MGMNRGPLSDYVVNDQPEEEELPNPDWYREGLVLISEAIALDRLVEARLISVSLLKSALMMGLNGEATGDIARAEKASYLAHRAYQHYGSIQALEEAFEAAKPKRAPRAEKSKAVVVPESSNVA